jgi:DNA-binding SARP family transcriptional activator/tetratricopeptide (TPR) repeat protein
LRPYQEPAPAGGRTRDGAGSLAVETLGPLRARAGTRELDLGPPKQRAVFAILALSTNSVVSRDELIDHLWGESPPATAAGSLHTYVSGLRRVLDGLDGPDAPLTSTGPGYSLRLDPEGLDIAVVERLAAKARSSRAGRDPDAAVAAFDEALARWRPGAVLTGLPGPYLAEHRVWVSNLQLGLLAERAEVHLELGRPSTVADRLLIHVSANPYHERLRALLMTALHQSGRTADALAQYQELRKLLAEELGIDPSAELQNLHASILADNVTKNAVMSRAGTVRACANQGAPAPEAAAPAPAARFRPAQLPLGVGGFVGRDASIRQVLDAARGASADAVSGGSAYRQIVMIVGPGGVGKTALAVHCGHLLSADYPDGQLYVNLRGFGPRNPGRAPVDALHHLLTSVDAGTIPADREQRIALWRTVVRDKRLLIVLDNAESADQVEDLLPGGGPSFILVTSRNRLSGLAVRYAALRVTLSPLTPDESLELLSSSIGSVRVTAEPSAARRLADLCDHLPLALRIASEQVYAGSQALIADLTTELEHVQGRLDALQLPDDELSSVRAVLSWSYAGLDADAAYAFRTLGLFPGVSIRAEAAAALLDVPLPAASAALRNLAAQHLVESAGPSYWMHDLTRIYAEEVAHGDGLGAPRREALERVLQWYVLTLTQEFKFNNVRLPFVLPEGFRHQPLHFRDQQELVSWCAREWDNIAPLVRTAQRVGCHEQAWQLAYLLFDYFYAAGQLRDWVETLRLGMRSAEMLDNRRAQATLLNHLSVAYSRLGQNEAAVRQLQHGLHLLDDLGEDTLRISLLGNLASTLREAKQYATALPHAQQALDLARRSGSDYYEAGALDILCELHAELGEFEEALRYGEPGLVAARSCRNALLEANILINLGVAEHGRGEVETALGHFEEALALCGSGGDRYHEALALFGLARVHRARSDRPLAGDLAGRALQRLEDLEAEEVADVAQFLRTL